MQTTRKMQEDLIYVGASDRRISLFENLFPIPRGVSYNSYLLLDEKTVLFDTADEAVSTQFFDNLEYALGTRALNYIIVHHMEPDHCVLLQQVLTHYPSCEILCSSKAQSMIAQFFPKAAMNKVQVVSEASELCTGRHTLRFYMTPMVHWPEVMMTYDTVDKILYSADAFGMFGALSGNIFADEIDFDAVWLADARRYYTNIVGKFGAQVQAALKKTAALEIRMLCPLHGPIWRKNFEGLMEKYRLWSTYEPEEKAIMLAYASMYGNTENAMEVLANMLAQAGRKNLVMYDVSSTDLSVLIAESFRCSHIILAAPTYNGGIHPRMEAYLNDIHALNLQNRTVALVENGTWAPTAAAQMEHKLSRMKNMKILTPYISLKSALAQDQLQQLAELVQIICAQLSA